MPCNLLATERFLL